MKNLLNVSLLLSAVFCLTSFGLMGCTSATPPAPTVQNPQHAAHGGDRAKEEAAKNKGGKSRAHSPK